MKVLNFGSLNIDYVYTVDHIARPGETIASQRLEVFCGGKGLNQSIALARAGLAPFHAGMIGEDGGMLRALCEENGVDTRFIKEGPVRTGNATIQVDREGQNSILLFGGANRQLEEGYIREVIRHFEPGDLLLLQNEVNLLDHIIECAYGRGIRIALNPSPFDEAVLACDLAKVGLLFINEVEGEELAGCGGPERILETLAGRYTGMQVVLTLGEKGAMCRSKGQVAAHGVYDLPVVDTTGAGDTFTGYFISGLAQGLGVAQCLQLASAAAGLAVSRKGAAEAIPWRGEVEALL